MKDKQCKYNNCNNNRICCNCFWADQCCNGCKDMEVCDDYTPLDENEKEYGFGYIDECDRTVEERFSDYYEDGSEGWSDTITSDWLSGKDISGDEYWEEFEDDDNDDEE